MGKRGAVLAIVVALFIDKAVSQELSHQVMLPAAGIITTATIEFTQTVGETAVEIFSNEDNVITQGFQQPRMDLSSGTKPGGTGVNAYPNPVSDILTIELFGETARSFVISIVNIYGSAVLTTDLNFTGPYWYKLEQPVDNLPPGLYLVNIVSGDKVVRRTIKIEKM
jgi:Secretion system C-terminal sorting domain